MKPTYTLSETRTPNGTRFSLHEHDGTFSLKLDGRELMNSSCTSSELLLAERACTWPKHRPGAKVLIGGLGLGFSLRRTLELVGPNAIVEVAELLPDVVQWNQEFLLNLNGKFLLDPRVKVITGDVYDCIKKARPEYYDAILLDVDNGPTSLVQPLNGRLYKQSGFGLIRRCLKDEGKVAFWSAEKEPAFKSSLESAGFVVQEFEAKSHERAKQSRHRIYIGERVEFLTEIRDKTA
jgi:spermidine synthase